MILKSRVFFLMLGLVFYPILSNCKNKPHDPNKLSIPILCYHQIRDWKINDPKKSKVYITPVDVFKKQMKMLHDSGFHFILPDELLLYYTKNGPLPSKPIMISFDDGTLSQYENALPELNKYRCKAVFFIMTVAINKPKFMNDMQIKELANEGHVIGCHTWNHKTISTYSDADWIIQLKRSTDQLEKITDKPVTCFAYPNGIWNVKAIDELKLYGFTTAYQLLGKQDINEPLYTIRRILVDGNWNANLLLKAIKINVKTSNTDNDQKAK